MSFLQLKNRAASTLSYEIDSDDTTLTVASGAAFPSSGPFRITCEDEIMECTSRSGNVLTVIRAQEGTVAAGHTVGKDVRSNITAGVISQCQTPRTATVLVAASNSPTAWKNQADYLCTGTNDHSVIHDAIEDMPSGSGIVRLAPGDYYLGGYIDIDRSDFLLDLEGATIHYSSSGNSHIYCLGSYSSPAYLSANAARGDKVISVTGADAYISVGDYVRFESEATVGGCEIGEYQRCRAVTSTTLTLEGGLMDNYNTADSAKVRKLIPWKNITIRGGTFVGNGDAWSGNELGVYFLYCADIRLENIKVNTCSHAGIILKDCVDVWISNCEVNGSAQSGYGYGIDMIGCTQNVVIDNCIIRECRHNIAAGALAGAYQGPKNILINNCIFTGDGGYGVCAVDCHGMAADFWRVQNCVFQGVARGVGLGARTWAVDGCTFVMATDAAHYAIGDRDNTSKKVSVSNCVIHSDGYGVSVTSTSLEELIVDNIHVEITKAIDYSAVAYHGAVPANCTIMLNNIRSLDTNAKAHLIHFETSQSSARIYISNCILCNGDRGGVFLKGFSGGRVQNCVCNNNGKGSSSVNGARAGIALENCTNIEVVGNTVRDSTDSQLYGVQEIGTTDYSVVAYNVGKGNGSGNFATIGSNTTKQYNTDLGTSN